MRRAAAHREEAVTQVALHLLARPAQDRGRLLHRHPAVVRERERVPLLVGKRLQEPGLWGSKSLKAFVATGLNARAVDGREDRTSKRQALRDSSVRCSAPDVQEAALDGVRGVLRIAEEDERQPVGGCCVAVVELRKGSGVSGLKPPDQVCIGSNGERHLKLRFR